MSIWSFNTKVDFCKCVIQVLLSYFTGFVKAFIEENHNEVTPNTMGRKMSDSRSIPVVKNMEPEHLEERIKKELVSLGLCDEAEVIMQKVTALIGVL